MADRQLIPLRGLNVSTPAPRAEPGTCRTLEGAIFPTGRNGWAPAPEGASLSQGRVQSLDRQLRDGGDRIVALLSEASQSNEDLVRAIDPDQGGASADLVTLSGADATRAVQTATVTQDTALVITSGTGVGAPESLRFVRGDTVTELPWPAPPRIDVSWRPISEATAIPAGRYVIRVAWRLEDGSIGPASGPYLAETPDGDGFEGVITIRDYPQGQPSGGWADRVEGLTVVVHPQATTTTATDVSALDVPGYRVAGFDGVPDANDELTWRDTLEGIIASESHDEWTLLHHQVAAGAAYSYNKRLFLGDVEYNYENPPLEYMVNGDGGNDYHLTMRVRIETNQGTITRYADPVGFSTTAAQSVAFRQNIIYYRDRRARSWEWLVADDYDGTNFDAASWEVVDIGSLSGELQAAANANFAYVVPSRNQTSLLYASTSSEEVTNNNGWTGPLSTSVTNQDTGASEQSNTATLDVESALLANDEDLISALFEVTLSVEFGGNATNAFGIAELTVAVEDGNGNVLQDQKEVLTGQQTRDFGIELDEFEASQAEVLRVETYAFADGGPGTREQVTSEASVDVVQIATGTEGTGQSASVDRSAAHAVVDRDSNRLVWSETLRPLDLPAENVTYIGQGEGDPILAITANALPVSEGQYGDYPLLVLNYNSLWAVETGETVIQSVSPLSTDLGLVGRDAYVNANGPVVVATPRGVTSMTPQLREEYLSTPLHDPDDTFLNALGPDTALGFFSTGDRREIWVGANQRVYVYSLDGGVWSTLPTERTTFAQFQDTLYGADSSQSLLQEGAATSTYTIVAELVPFDLGAPANAKRVRDVWLDQGRPPPEGETSLLHVRAVGEGAWGLDYTTTPTKGMRLFRGLGQAFSIWLKVAGPADMTLLRFGIEFELRDRSTPRPRYGLDGDVLGPDATTSDLDNDLDW